MNKPRKHYTSIILRMTSSSQLISIFSLVKWRLSDSIRCRKYVIDDTINYTCPGRGGNVILVYSLTIFQRSTDSHNLTILLLLYRHDNNQDVVYYTHNVDRYLQLTLPKSCRSTNFKV